MIMEWLFAWFSNFNTLWWNDYVCFVCQMLLSDFSDVCLMSSWIDDCRKIRILKLLTRLCIFVNYIFHALFVKVDVFLKSVWNFYQLSISCLCFKMLLSMMFDWFDMLTRDLTDRRLEVWRFDTTAVGE